jgi:hypothetical protein
MKSKGMAVCFAGLIAAGVCVPAGWSQSASGLNEKDEVKKLEEEMVSEKSAQQGSKGILKPVKGVASGVKEVASGTKEIVAETVEETTSGPPIVGTMKGIGKGAEAALDSTVKGAYKVATLGYGELKDERLKKEPPKRQEDYDRVGKDDGGKPSTFKISF